MKSPSKNTRPKIQLVRQPGESLTAFNERLKEVAKNPAVPSDLKEVLNVISRHLAREQ